MNFDELLEKYISELEGNNIIVSSFEKTDLRAFVHWLKRNAAQHSVQADGDLPSITVIKSNTETGAASGGGWSPSWTNPLEGL